MKSEKESWRSYVREDRSKGRRGMVLFLGGFGSASVLWLIVYLASDRCALNRQCEPAQGVSVLSTKQRFIVAT